MNINNFTSIDSVYGPVIVNRHCAFQAESLIKTGRPHIQDELNKILDIVNTLPENSVTVDAGANIGLVALPIAHLVSQKKGVVHAFEAQRMMAYALGGSVALNDLENLLVYNQALGSSAGVLTADKPDYGQPQDFGTFSLVEQNEAQAESIQVVSIDSLKLDRLDFFKIDVEGMEIDVLAGSQKSIRSHLPWCWIEYWKVDIADIKAQFKGLDYKFYVMDQLNLLCAPAGRLSESQLNVTAEEV